MLHTFILFFQSQVSCILWCMLTKNSCMMPCIIPPIKLLRNCPVIRNISVQGSVTYDYMDSIWYDVENAKREITTYPMYLILNLARVLAYKEEGLVLSKKEGGEWALKKLPTELHHLIQDALSEYSDSEHIVYNKRLAKKYAKYMIERIKE